MRRIKKSSPSLPHRTPSHVRLVVSEIGHCDLANQNYLPNFICLPKILTDLRLLRCNERGTLVVIDDSEKLKFRWYKTKPLLFHIRDPMSVSWSCVIAALPSSFTSAVRWFARGMAPLVPRTRIFIKKTVDVLQSSRGNFRIFSLELRIFVPMSLVVAFMITIIE